MTDSCLLDSRHRPTEEAVRSRRHQTTLPRPLRVPSHRNHYPRRELLSPYTITDTEGAITVERCRHRKHIVESLSTYSVDARDTCRSIGRQCLRSVHRAVLRVLQKGREISEERV